MIHFTYIFLYFTNIYKGYQWKYNKNYKEIRELREKRLFAV